MVYSTIVCCFLTTCFHAACPWQAWPLLPQRAQSGLNFLLAIATLPGHDIQAKLLPIASLLSSCHTSPDHDLRLLELSARGCILSSWASKQLLQHSACLDEGEVIRNLDSDCHEYSPVTTRQIRWRSFLEAPGLCCLQSVTIASPASCQTWGGKNRIDSPIWIFCELSADWVCEWEIQSSERREERDELPDPRGQEAAHLEPAQWQECAGQRARGHGLCAGAGEAGRHGQRGGHHGGGQGGQHRPPHRQ